MKHFTIILVLVIMPLMLFGQQAIIDLALNGREKGYICKVENNYQMLSERHIRAYCAKHGFVVVNVINKYGGVVSFSILPKNEVDLYVYNSKIGEPQKCGYSRLTATGRAETFLFGKLDFKWSGNVTDGMINGTGSGFAKISDKQYCYVHAEFVNGLPKGDVEFVKYYYSGDDPTVGNISTYRYYFSDYSEGMAYVKCPGSSNYGLANAETGVIVARHKFYNFVEPFNNGHGVVGMHYGTTDSETNCPSCSGRGAMVGCSACGGDGYTGWSNDIRCSTCNGTGAHKCSKCNGKGRVHSPGTPIIKEIVIDKNGNFVDWSDRQKSIDEAERIAAENAEKARQQRIKDSLDRIEQLRIEAERKKAELERKLAINSNSKLWHQGDHICYSLPNYSGKITCGTLEEWNQGHTKAKIKVVTSPSNTATYNGELLQKNNTFWIDAKGTKWHLALEGEFEESLTYDNSIKGPDVIYQQVPSSSPHRYDDCDYCKGSGKIACYSCGGDGYGGWGNDEYCTTCKGRGMEVCYHCHGTGRK